MVPITMSTSEKPETSVQTVLLDSPSTTVTLSNVKPGNWVKVSKLNILYFMKTAMIQLYGNTAVYVIARVHLSVSSRLRDLKRAQQESVVS